MLLKIALTFFLKKNVSAMDVPHFVNKMYLKRGIKFMGGPPIGGM